MGSSDNKYDFLDPPAGSEGDLGTLGHYRVIDDLGKGGMGYVFLAEDTRLKREVALKVMNQKIAATPGSRKRFISEARSMAAVHHDNVATIFEVGEYKGTPFMSMELLEGTTLERYRERSGEPDYHLLLRYARDIAKGLAAAHAQGIVHRDIKPANIWLDTKTNRIKILDFGLALAQTPVDQLSGRGAVVGTPGYLSPEQARSEPLDDRSDLYSAGVVLYELATGALPLKSKTVAEQLIAILVHEPKPIRDRNEKIPQPLADMIHRLMAKEPRDRYRSAADLEQALDSVEVECESKSEVAQAINQLQLGLEQAVKKKDRSFDKPQETVPVSITSAPPPNPFETLPEMGALSPGVGGSGIHSAVPAASLAATQSGVHAAVPLGNKPGASGRVSRKPGSKSASGSGINPAWIVGGIAAVVLLVMVPAVVYYSTTSAIARQQNDPVVPLSSEPNQSADRSGSGAEKAAGGASKPKGAGASAQKRGRPAGSTRPAKSLMNGDTTLVTTAAVKPFTGEAVGQSRWLLSNKKGNGSFENGQISKGQTSIPGWTLQVNGAEAGWTRDDKIKSAEGKTYAFAGPASEALLISDTPANYLARPGDRFRVSASIGGEGQGQSQYRMVLGFRRDGEVVKRFQIASLKDDAAWYGGKQKKLRYEIEVDETVKEAKPFLEILISNLQGNRKRAMVDRVSVVVIPAGNSLSNPAGTKPKPNGRPQPKPSSMASSSKGRSATSPGTSPSTPKSTGKPSQKPSAAPVAVPAKVATGPQAVRDEVIKTSDDSGADTTVKRGTQESLGSKPSLAIQTRKGRHIQHTYLRFPLAKLVGPPRNGNRNRGGNNNKRKPIPVVNATVKLDVVSLKGEPVTVRVYGLDNPVSDIWLESKLPWAKSLSEDGLDKLPLIAEEKLAQGENQLVISNELLSRFIAGSGQNSVTLILTGSDGDALVNFASKENRDRSPPTLVLGLSE